MVLKFMRRPQADLDLHVYDESFTPGSEVRFRAAISSRKGFEVRKAKISLVCVETYWVVVSNGKTTSQQKRTRTLTEISHEFLSDGRIQPGIAHREESSLTLPQDAILTVASKHAKLLWELKLSIDVPGRRDLHREQPFNVVAPQSSDEDQRSEYDPPVITEEVFDDCRLRLELPAGNHRTGDSLDGRLRLDAIKDCEFPEVRVELTRDENAGVRKGSAVVDQVVLEKDAKYAANRMKEWTFTLRIPEGLWPTTMISSTALSWQIKGILDRNRRRDFSVEKEITVT